MISLLFPSTKRWPMTKRVLSAQAFSRWMAFPAF